MADPNHKSQGKDRKRKYRSDGTPVWGKRHIDGPGIWVSCVKGKEKQTVGELYDLFDSLAAELWPPETLGDNIDDDHVDQHDEDLSIEDQVAKEIATINRPRKQQRFTNCQTNTPCVVFMSCKTPIDPVKLVVTHVNNVYNTGITRTRYTHRLVPVSETCVTNIQEIQALCGRIFTPYFSQHPGKKFKYKIDLRIRNHSTLTRSQFIQGIAQCVPEGHTVALESPEIFILVEVFKSICGISIVEDYYRLQKFNVMEIANMRNLDGQFNDGRVRETADITAGEELEKVG